MLKASLGITVVVVAVAAVMVAMVAAMAAVMTKMLIAKGLVTHPSNLQLCADKLGKLQKGFPQGSVAMRLTL